MNILINERGQAQCPRCGQWNQLEVEKIDGLLHEFTCCGNFVVAIDQENLKKFIEDGEEPPEPDTGWFIYKDTDCSGYEKLRDEKFKK